MMRRLRDLRLIPIVLGAAACLFVLKTAGLVFNGGYMFGDRGPRLAGDLDVTGSFGGPKRADGAKAQSQPVPKPSWAREMVGYAEVTGAVAESKPAEQQPEGGAAKGSKTAAKPQEPPPSPGGTPVPLDRTLSPAERAILERLGERRNELDARGREMDMRENLIKAAEKRLEARINELKELEARVSNTAQAKDEAEVARFKNLITMYENMKAKDAAKIFDRLDLRVLIEVVTQLNPRRMSDILAQMSPEAGEKLTMEFAARAAKDKVKSPELPKIEGRPTAN